MGASIRAWRVRGRVGLTLGAWCGLKRNARLFDPDDYSALGVQGIGRLLTRLRNRRSAEFIRQYKAFFRRLGATTDDMTGSAGTVLPHGEIGRDGRSVARDRLINRRLRKNWTSCGRKKDGTKPPRRKRTRFAVPACLSDRRSGCPGDSHYPKNSRGACEYSRKRRPGRSANDTDVSWIRRPFGVKFNPVSRASSVLTLRPVPKPKRPGDRRFQLRPGSVRRRIFVLLTPQDLRLTAPALLFGLVYGTPAPLAPIAGLNMILRKICRRSSVDGVKSDLTFVQLKRTADSVDILDDLVDYTFFFLRISIDSIIAFDRSTRIRKFLFAMLSLLAKLGFISFGGPLADRIITRACRQGRWLAREFLHALNSACCFPARAQQLATYIAG